MNWLEVKHAINKVVYDPETQKCIPMDGDKPKEVTVHFDFPLTPGGQREFKIASITEHGIMIRNDSIERPKGYA